MFEKKINVLCKQTEHANCITGKKLHYTTVVCTI